MCGLACLAEAIVELNRQFPLERKKLAQLTKVNLELREKIVTMENLTTMDDMFVSSAQKNSNELTVKEIEGKKNLNRLSNGNNGLWSEGKI